MNTEKTKSNGKFSQSAQSQVTDAAKGIQETAKKIYDQAFEAGSDFVAQANKKVPELVREYPVYATLGGLCVGFLLGASLIGRRSGRVSEEL